MEESFYTEAFRQFRTKDFPQFRNTSIIFSDIHDPKLFPKYVIVRTAYEIRCAIWCHLYSLKNVKNTHGAVLNFSKVQCYFY